MDWYYIVTETSDSTIDESIASEVAKVTGRVDGQLAGKLMAAMGPPSKRQRIPTQAPGRGSRKSSIDHEVASPSLRSPPTPKQGVTELPNPAIPKTAEELESEKKELLANEKAILDAEKTKAQKKAEAKAKREAFKACPIGRPRTGSVESTRLSGLLKKKSLKPKEPALPGLMQTGIHYPECQRQWHKHTNKRLFDIRPRNYIITNHVSNEPYTPPPPTLSYQPYELT